MILYLNIASILEDLQNQDKIPPFYIAIRSIVVFIAFDLD